MITSIRAKHLGPHADHTVVLGGQTTIEAPMQAGKSTIIDALCIALWGVDRDGKSVPADMVRDGYAKATAEVSAHIDGTDHRWARSLTSGRKWSREYRSTSTSLLDLTGADMADTVPWSPLARLVVVPLAWLPLAQGPGGGRPLRDALDELLPGPSGADVLAEALHPGEPDTEKLASAARRDAKRDADEAVGALGGAVSALQRATAAMETPPEPGELERAQASRPDLAAALEAYDARAAKVAACKPDQPRPTAEQIRNARTNHQAAQQLVDATLVELAEAHQIGSELAKAIPLPEGLSAARNAVEAGASAKPCPGVDPSACRMGAALRSAADRAATEVERLEAEHAAAVEGRGTKLAAARKRYAEARDAERAAEQDATKAGKAYQALMSLDVTWEAYDQAAAALGERPPEPDAAMSPQEAREVLDRAARCSGQAEALQRAREARQAAKARHVVASTVAKRAEKVLTLVREAPGKALRAKLGALPLADTGVAIEVPDDGAAIVLTIDGRDWRRASTGRLVQADAALRAAIRSASPACAGLPVIIDGVQDLGDADIHVPSPAVYLRTGGDAWAEEVTHE